MDNYKQSVIILFKNFKKMIVKFYTCCFLFQWITNVTYIASVITIASLFILKPLDEKFTMENQNQGSNLSCIIYLEKHINGLPFILV